jgi:LEA14-like dessication related protein
MGRKSPNILPLVLFGGGLLVWGSAKAAAKALSAKSLNVKLSNIDFATTPPKIEITLINPYKGYLELENITADLIFNGNAIGTIWFNQVTAIPPNKMVKIKTNVQLNLLDASGVLIDLINKPKKDWKKYFTSGKFQVKGSLTAENAILPLELTWQF